MIFLIIFACFVVGGTTTNLDDFLLIGMIMISAFLKNKIHLKFLNFFLILLLIINQISNMIQRGTYEFTNLLTLCSVLSMPVIITQLCKHDVLIERLNSRYSKLQIFFAWVIIVLYIGWIYTMFPGRISSPGVLLNATIITDSHIFAAQVAILSLACFYQSGKFRLVILLISFVALISIGSRSGPYILFIGVLGDLIKNGSKENLKFLLFVISISVVALYLIGQADPLQLTNQTRSFSLGGVTDQHRLQILQRATQSLSFSDILFGEDDAFRRGIKYYDNFFMTLVLLTGVMGVAIFCAITFIPLANRRAYILIIILLSLFPLSDFLLIPRFQIIMYVLILVCLHQGNFRHVRQNN